MWLTFIITNVYYGHVPSDTWQRGVLSSWQNCLMLLLFRFEFLVTDGDGTLLLSFYNRLSREKYLLKRPLPHPQGDSLFLWPIRLAISNPSWYLLNLVFCLSRFKSHTVAFTFLGCVVKWFLIYLPSHVSIITNFHAILSSSPIRNPTSVRSRSLFLSPHSWQPLSYFCLYALAYSGCFI